MILEHDRFEGGKNGNYFDTQKRKKIKDTKRVVHTDTTKKSVR